jgi:hypothetical protein
MRFELFSEQIADVVLNSFNRFVFMGDFLNTCTSQQIGNESPSRVTTLIETIKIACIRFGHCWQSSGSMRKI